MSKKHFVIVIKFKCYLRTKKKSCRRKCCVEAGNPELAKPELPCVECGSRLIRNSPVSLNSPSNIVKRRNGFLLCSFGVHILQLASKTLKQEHDDALLRNNKVPVWCKDILLYAEKQESATRNKYISKKTLQIESFTDLRLQVPLVRNQLWRPCDDIQFDIW